MRRKDKKNGGRQQEEENKAPKRVGEGRRCIEIGQWRRRVWKIKEREREKQIVWPHF